ncbi:hypothetical protein E2C01_046926 [Portunus trituberculatus]|uniref:Uncharacterized protein n=1 Tax=Portunus trituberculatus TaxID=210409 RepID=A0A5B7G284_PORTR|nr:hypothetical protein [Portunus trituberculatus]
MVGIALRQLEQTQSSQVIFVIDVRQADDDPSLPLPFILQLLLTAWPASAWRTASWWEAAGRDYQAVRRRIVPAVSSPLRPLVFWLNPRMLEPPRGFSSSPSSSPRSLPSVPPLAGGPNGQALPPSPWKQRPAFGAT